MTTLTSRYFNQPISVHPQLNDLCSRREASGSAVTANSLSANSPACPRNLSPWNVHMSANL